MAVAYTSGDNHGCRPRTLLTKDGQWIGHGQGKDAHPN